MVVFSVCNNLWFVFQKVSGGFKFQEGAVSDSDNDSDSLFSDSVITHHSYHCDHRFWLEASTLSNRGEMRQHLPTDNELHLLPLAGSQYQTKQMTWYYLSTLK